MPIVVSDTSCMIDLRKADLLEVLLRLPHRFVMPRTLFEDEWLCLTGEEKTTLRAQGLEIVDLSGEQTLQAQKYFNLYNGLKLNDCFALALAQETADSILMTGDRRLRKAAGMNGIEVRGILWLTDELENHVIVEPRILYDALRLLRDDDLVFLPRNEVVHRLKRLEKSI